MKDKAPPNKPMGVIILPKNQKYVSSTLILNLLLSFVMKKPAKILFGATSGKLYLQHLLFVL